MNERMKILELLQSGKITTEQADLLLAALDDADGTKNTKHTRSPKSFHYDGSEFKVDLKSLSNQISSSVSQALSEAKRGLESIDFWSTDTITETLEQQLPEHITSLIIESTNGKMRIATWEKPYVQIGIRSEVRTTDVTRAKRILQDALQVREEGQRYSLRILFEGGRECVCSASIELFIPSSLHEMNLKTKNGGIQGNHFTLSEANFETLNGNIVLFHAKVERLRATTNNGRIELVDSITPVSTNVYTTSKNGTVMISGIEPDTRCVGTAQTSFGHVEIDVPSFDVTFTNDTRKNHASFVSKEQPTFTGNSDPLNQQTTQLHCETKNGRITIKS